MDGEFNPVTTELLLESYPGTLSFCAENLASGARISWREDQISATASCIKLFLLVALFAQAERGQVSLDERTVVAPGDHVGGSGVLKHLSPGVGLSWRDVATLMIVLSDNIATNMVIDQIGLEVVNQTIHALGFRQTHLVNRIDFDAIGGDIAKLAVSTAADSVACLKGLAMGTVVSPEASRAMLDILSRQHYVDLLPRYLPYDPYARDLGRQSAVSVAGKTGFFPGFRGDIVLLGKGDEQVVMAAFASGADLSFAPENAIARALGEIGRSAFIRLTRP
ncbi:serine hydrolase [Devosia sp. FKR38]|uniref:serine hydrolase n=1 Tax=Devosia sp. FKR38 TaxID=2562312 RepID=UPI0010C12EE2|nr:serine hydrolase [Devosia sp. FKR38]